MLMPGALVRRQRRRKVMVVLQTEGDSITCGWTDNGRFYKRRFPADQLRLCMPWSDMWPMT
ncbi:MAG: hypothetical protein QM578_15285 [Pantoea sp.]|uniref:hypothetical protein n=1 Tax=unclassified Pantoea TaxID=2630326 RepID=UPI0003AC7C0B|nr:hypothetical protein [Pantoea sp. AS-PWVM4]ERK05826.1 hypothetical protein L579_3129 [Pantoea sp. AS-PWVM4]